VQGRARVGEWEAFPKKFIHSNPNPIYNLCIQIQIQYANALQHPDMKIHTSAYRYSDITTDISLISHLISFPLHLISLVISSLMPTILLRLTDDEFFEIKERSSSSSLKQHAYIKRVLFGRDKGAVSKPTTSLKELYASQKPKSPRIDYSPEFAQ